MKHITPGILSLIFILLFSGCVPEQRIIWSPDGKQAVVLGRENDEQTLYLCDVNGALSPRLFNNALRVAWRPDSRGLVLSRGRVVTSWADAQSLLAPEEKSDLVEIAETVYANSQSGDMHQSIEATLDTLQLTDNQRNIIKLYFKHHHMHLVSEEAWEREQPLKAVLSVIEVADVDGTSIQVGRVIAGSALPVWGLRISPRNRAVAYTSGGIEMDEPPLSLFVASLDDATPPRRIAENASMYADWSADGQYLAYAVSSNKARDDKLQLGTIARSKVADASGRILNEIPGRDELVGVIMNGFARVRCLPDGHIVFSGNEIQLPAAANDMLEQATLFRFHPDQRVPASRLFPRNVEPYLSEWSLLFEFSPDYRQIAFPDSDNRVSIFTLATGEVRQTPVDEQKTTDSDMIGSLPSWRSSDELCFTRTVENEAGDLQVEVVIYSPGREPQTRVLSTEWPSELIESLAE